MISGVYDVIETLKIDLKKSLKRTRLVPDTSNYYQTDITDVQYGVYDYTEMPAFPSICFWDNSIVVEQQSIGELVDMISLRLVLYAEGVRIDYTQIHKLIADVRVFLSSSDNTNQCDTEIGKTINVYAQEDECIAWIDIVIKYRHAKGTV